MIESGLLSTDVERDVFLEGDYHCLPPYELEQGGGEGEREFTLP